jgi:hypothetical protein
MAGWWHYPYDPRATGPALGLDLIAGVVAGGAFGLVGWRLTGRFGRRGLAGFLIAWSIWGPCMTSADPCCSRRAT